MNPSGDSSRSISSTMLVGLRTRQPDAWGRLVDVWHPVIYGWCRKQGVGDAAAEDIVQDVLFQVFLNVPTFQRTTFKGWVWKITRRKIIDHVRIIKRLPLDGGPRGVDDLSDPIAGDDSVVELDPGSDADIVRRVLGGIRGTFSRRPSMRSGAPPSRATPPTGSPRISG